MRRKIPTFHLRLPSQLPPTGDLQRFPGYGILQWAARHDFSGWLVFERQERRKELFLDRGTIVGSRSNLVPEGLDLFLSHRYLAAGEVAGLISQGDPASSDADPDVSLFKQVERSGRLSADDLEGIKNARLIDHAMNLVGWFDGTYRIEPGEKLPLSLVILAPEAPIPLLQVLEHVEGHLVGREDESLFPPEPRVPSSGELRMIGGGTVISSLAEAGATGQLLFERGSRRKLVRWNAGAIVTVASTDPAETLLVVLRRWRFLPQKMIETLESESQGGSTRLRDVIREKELLSENRLHQALLTLHYERILEAYSWRSGRYEFQGKREEKALPKKVPIPSETQATPVLIRAEPPAPEGMADHLSRLFTSDVTSVCLIGVPRSPEVETAVGEMLGAWNDQGHPTLLTDLDRNEVVDPEKKEHFERFLYFGSETRTEDSLPVEIGPVVFAISSAQTKKRSLRQAIAHIGSERVAGFVYVEAQPFLWNLDWHHLKDRFKVRWLRRE